jgi:ribonuclease HI
MGKAKNNFYVVWVGKTPGIYTSWEACKQQVNGVEGAKYKGFATKIEAEKAFASSPENVYGRKKNNLPDESLFSLPGGPIANSIAVDAACSGNPGKMEYKGVYTFSGTELFLKGPFEDATNNVGEFLALVHALAWLKQQKLDLPVYSDSRNAISWVAQKTCKTKLVRTQRNADVFELIARAENWLKANSFSTKILKWETKLWGEIPADFGRK